jgi:DNA uptake protein ComE-like DNA-binding protein
MAATRRVSAHLVAAVLATLLAAGCALFERVERITHGPPRGVDLNQASPGELADLPGLTEEDAERIIRERPYAHKDDIVERGIVSQDRFEKFADRVYVSRPRPPGGSGGIDLP